MGLKNSVERLEDSLKHLAAGEPAQFLREFEETLRRLPEDLPRPPDEPLRQWARGHHTGLLPVSFINVADLVLDTARACSLWWLQFGLACCAIESMAVGASRYDLDRFGIFHRATPRQADAMLVAGTVTIKMAPIIKRLYDQMPEPRYVIAVGNCAISGGRFYQHAYSVVKGIDRVLPVDIYIPGCPPRPESFIDGLRKLHVLIKQESLADPPTVAGERPAEYLRKRELP
jgi:NADH-quinone oxidoreductase subunit B